MPKRKYERSDDYEKLFKKFKKLEKKLRRRCRSRSRSSEDSYRAERREQEYLNSDEDCTMVENNVSGLLDGNTTQETGGLINNDAEPNTHPPAVEPNVEPNLNATASEHPVAASAGVESTEIVLANEVLEILGEDPAISNTYGDEIHKDLAVRLEHIATNGLTKEQRKELIEKYLLPQNCKLIDAPGLNAEIKAGISDLTAKRDKNIETRQKQVATAISCLSQAINTLITSNNADPAIIKLLMDTERILCDCQHSDSTIRRNFILSTMKKEMKDQLQSTKPDNLLFGQNLTETIKTAKAINKSGAELKTPTTKPPANTGGKKFTGNAGTSKNLNWRGPYPPRKQPNHPKTKEPPQNKNRQSSSSKHSRQRRTRDRR